MPPSDTNESNISSPYSGASEAEAPPDSNGEWELMLSKNFLTPPSGEARNAIVQRMSQNHPAMPNLRRVQRLLHTTQTSLLRIPGVCSNEAQQMVNDLREVARMVSHETGQLVDGLVNMKVDAQYAQNDCARMGVDATLQKAELDQTREKVKQLNEALKDVREKAQKEREGLEKELDEAKSDLQMMSDEFARFRDRVQQSSGSRDEMVRSLEELVQHLEDQVNNRRSLWILRHNDPEMIAKAFHTMYDSVQDRTMLPQSLGNLSISNNSNGPGTMTRANVSNGIMVPANGLPTHMGQRTPTAPPQTPFAHQTEFNHAPPRGPSALQQLDRHHNTRSPSAFSPLHAGPPRAPSTRPNGRQFGAWAPTGQGNRSVSVNQGLASPGYNRPTSRPRYQPQRMRGENWMGPSHNDNGPSRPGTSMGYRDNHYPGYAQTVGFPRGRSRPMLHGAFDPHSSSQMALAGNELMRGNGGTSLIHLTSHAVTGWSDRMDDLYGCIRSFVDNHASEIFGPEPHRLETTKTWPVLVACYSPLQECEAASYMEHHLRSAVSKKCLVTRLVVDYIVNCVWTVFAWKGFDEESDQAIDHLWRDLCRTEGQPSHMRQPLLDRQATILDDIMKHPRPLAEFRTNAISKIATALITNLEPVFDSDVNPHGAYNALYAVGEQAWELSSRILTSRLTFDFRFPEVGSRFSCQSMVPVWPADTDPMELQAKHWRVAMVTTPVVTCRNDTGTNISAHSVCLADVICMQ